MDAYGTVNWALVDGTLPPGLKWTPVTREDFPYLTISGTPTVAGTWPLTFEITDGFGQSSQQQFVIAVSAQPISVDYSFISGPATVSRDMAYSFSVSRKHPYPHRERQWHASESESLNSLVNQRMSRAAESYRVQSVAPDDSHVLVACSTKMYLYLVDVAAQNAVRVNINDGGSQSSTQSSELIGFGISADNHRVLFADSEILTASAASEPSELDSSLRA